MDIVEILLCEGGDVEQWLEPQNISSCLRLDLFSQLFFSYILHYFTLLISYTCVVLVVRPHLCLIKRAFKAPQLIIQRNQEE